MFTACFYEFSIWIPNFPKFLNSKTKILFIIGEEFMKIQDEWCQSLVGERKYAYLIFSGFIKSPHFFLKPVPVGFYITIICSNFDCSIVLDLIRTSSDNLKKYFFSKNCSIDLKIFENLRLKAEKLLTFFSINFSIFSHSMSEQFSKQNAISPSSKWRSFS